MPRRLVMLILVVVGLVGTSALASPSPIKQCFNIPGIPDCIDGRFGDYWNSNGGVFVFGYPITAEQPELVPDDNQDHDTQWFQRNRMELHPEKAAPYDVLLGRLGAELLTDQGREFASEDNTAPAVMGGTCQHFVLTNKDVCGPFLAYYRSHGLNDPRLDPASRSLQLFGLPLSGVNMETNPNGDTVLTQWFERARFEMHPENPPDNQVLLGLLGVEHFGTGSSPSLPSPTPTAQPPTSSAGIRIVSSSSFRSQYSSSLYIVGEVQNNTGETIQFVRIVASLYNASNRLVGTEDTYAKLEIMTPGQKAPFKVIVSSPSADYDHYKLQAEYEQTTKKPIQGLTLLSQSDQPAGYDNTHYIIGEVRNDSGKPIKFFRVIATLYNSSGSVVNTEDTYAKLETLQPGQTSPYKIIVDDWRDTARYAIVLEAELAQ